MKNDDQLKKMLAEVTPRILVEAIDELLMVQLARRAATSTRRAVQGLARRPPQGTEPRGRPEVPGGAEAGRHDDRRPPQERREAVHDLSQVQHDEVGSKLTDHRRGGAAVLPSPTAGVHRAGQRHAARDPDRDPDRHPEAARRHQRGAGRRRPRRRATAIRARVLAGEDFAKVAAEVSSAASKANGGLIGPISVNELSEPLQRAADEDEAGRGDAADPRSPRATRFSSSRTLDDTVDAAVRSVRDWSPSSVYGERQQAGGAGSSSAASAARRSSSGRTTS